MNELDNTIHIRLYVGSPDVRVTCEECGRTLLRVEDEAISLIHLLGRIVGHNSEHMLDAI